MRDCIYSRKTGSLVMWISKDGISAYLSASHNNDNYAIVSIPENIATEIMAGVAEYKIIDGDLVKV